jgi:dTDP-4-amino-4,6-dideoxygalactose transaminase
MNIPFVDLYAQYLTIQTEMDAVIKDVITETAFIKGKYVDEFEKSYQQSYGVKNCIGVGNGTDAIYIALKMMGIGAGDEVITSASSWISTSESITQAGARPVFVDIDPDFYTLNADLIEEKITKNTKGIIPVHLYGMPADMPKIMEIAKKHNLFVLEDCAQAHYAEIQGKRVGTFGRVSTFSFFPGKNLGAYGDAGAILTDDQELAIKMRMYANHGALKKHFHDFEGVNSRLDGLQAGILNVKLPHIHTWTAKRNEIAQKYTALLKNVSEVVPPKMRPGSKHVFHVYNIRCQKRDELRDFLESCGISVMVHYPTPLPFMPAYKYLNHVRTDFPVVADYQDKILSLPIYPEMEDEAIEYVVVKIKEFYSKK